MSIVSAERITQNRIVRLFQSELGYDYLGNWERRDNNSNIEYELLTRWLKPRYSDKLLRRAMEELHKKTGLGSGMSLYGVNQEVYRLLRYGVKVREGAGEQTSTVYLIDWHNPDANHFAIAEEVSIKGDNSKRPDIVLYVNGIALGVLELKRASVSVGEGIRQNLDNQKKDFIRNFFTTMQLVMAGNDSQGLRYGTIETAEQYYLEWKEESVTQTHDFKLDHDLSLMCSKARFLELIHDFIVFDAGAKKTCRHNQFFGVQAARQRLRNNEGGIIWHTQGSGKSLTMVWLAKWIHENIADSRVLIVTDRTELDEQIEKVFSGVEEEIYRTRSGRDLIATLNESTQWLMCSLVHKFGRRGDEEDESARDEQTEEYIQQLKASLPSDFQPKGRLFVFVDECHRTQSGKLHAAMTAILPEAVFIGFTGTPLLKDDKKKSIEVFGSYIHTYKFDEAVADGVVLDLRYEARDIDQQLTSPAKVDLWFAEKTKGLSRLGREQVMKRWGTMRQVLSSKDRLQKIVNDICMDMITRPRLSSGHGNAMLVCSSVYQACVTYDMFNRTDMAGKVAIVTSYQPTAASIKGEETGAGETESLFKYDTYRKMLADFYGISQQEAASKVEDFEIEVKRRFIKEPGQMRLLIVVDKLLTGFDAPSATYLYIDKSMADHNLFQAICRVNRLDTADKEYGYIVDYKDLFRSLDKAITDYTQEAFDGYQEEDIKGLLKNRLEEARKDLEDSLEMVRALCEPVPAPRKEKEFLHYFCGESGSNEDELLDKEALRLSFYQAVAGLIRAYANLANEMQDAGYSTSEQDAIRKEIADVEKLRSMLRLHSGDEADMKHLEPAMRQLVDMYIRADESEQLASFEDVGLLQILLNRQEDLIKALPNAGPDSTVNEGIENNLQRAITEKNPTNPQYYERMSQLLGELIEQRRKQAIAYKEYLEQVQELARKVLQTASVSAYPAVLDTLGKRAIYDNFGKNEALAILANETIYTKKYADWVGNRMRERALRFELEEALAGYEVDVDALLELAKQQEEYR